MSKRLTPSHTVIKPVQFLALTTKAVTHLIFCNKSLDNSQTTKSFLDIAHQSAPLVLRRKRGTFQILAHSSHDPSGQRQKHKNKQSQLPAQHQHHAQTADDHYRVFNNHVKRHHQRIFNLRHIACHTSHHIALTLACEKTNGQRHYLRIHEITYISDYSRTHRNNEISAQIRRAALQSGHDYQNHSQTYKRIHRPVLLHGLLHIIIKIIESHFLKRAGIGRHKYIVTLPDTEQYLKDRYYQSKRKKSKKHGEEIKRHVQKYILFVRRQKSPHYLQEFFHNDANLHIFTHSSKNGCILRCHMVHLMLINS